MATASYTSGASSFQPTPGGAVDVDTSAGKKATTGSGTKKQPGLSSAQVAAAVVPQKQAQQARPKMPQPRGQQAPQFSASNPMMSVQPPPIPHPGVSPPYPDARSPAPVLMPNGTPMLPLPKGFPLGSAGLRAPPSFGPQGMTGLLRR